MNLTLVHLRVDPLQWGTNGPDFAYRFTTGPGAGVVHEMIIGRLFPFNRPVEIRWKYPFPPAAYTGGFILADIYKGCGTNLTSPALDEWQAFAWIQAGSGGADSPKAWAQIQITPDGSGCPVVSQGMYFSDTFDNQPQF